MTDDKTAAKDPLFWSFHAYIDLVFDCWQKTQKITDVGCPDCPLRALPGNPTAKDVKSTAALGYTYDFKNTACTEPNLFAMPKVLALASHQKKSTPYVVDLTIPRPSFATAHVRLEGLPVFPDYNYSGRVFLYPATVTLASSDADFRGKYQVDRFAVWGLGDTEHAPHHEAAVTADVDASTELDYLAKKQAGTKWKIAVVVDKPSAQYESTRKNASAEVQHEITFDHVSVIYDRDYAKEQE
jgi:tyrosinase